MNGQSLRSHCKSQYSEVLEKVYFFKTYTLVCIVSSRMLNILDRKMLKCIKVRIEMKEVKFPDSFNQSCFLFSLLILHSICLLFVCCFLSNGCINLFLIYLQNKIQ